MSQALMPQDQIIVVGRRWVKVELEAHTQTLDLLLDPEVVWVGPVGLAINKAHYLAGRRSGDLKQQAFAWEGDGVWMYGDAAIAVGSQVQSGTFQGRDVSARFRG